MTLPSNWLDSSPCKGCGYGEQISAGVFCPMIQGIVPIGYQGCKAEHDHYEEQRKEEMGMTLEELAKELRKIFIFKYVTVADYKHGGPVTLDCWEYKPTFYDEDCTWRGFHHRELLYSFDTAGLACDIDLSEYRDADGNIDYSKCIVEVE